MRAPCACKSSGTLLHERTQLTQMIILIGWIRQWSFWESLRYQQQQQRDQNEENVHTRERISFRHLLYFAHTEHARSFLHFLRSLPLYHAFVRRLPFWSILQFWSRCNVEFLIDSLAVAAMFVAKEKEREHPLPLPRAYMSVPYARVWWRILCAHILHGLHKTRAALALVCI